MSPAEETQESSLAEELDARTIELLAMSNADRESYLAILSSEYDRELAKLSGLEQALGGPAATDAALAAAWTATSNQIDDAIGQPLQLGFRSAAATTSPNAGNSLFGAALATAAVATLVTESNALKVGEKKRSPKGSDLKFELTIEKVSFDLEATVQDGQLTTKLTMHVDLLPCPGPDGRFQVKARADISATAGTVGQTATLDVTLDGQLDDNAAIVSKDLTYRMQAADFASARGQFADVSGTYRDFWSINRTGGAVTQEFVDQSARLGSTWAMAIGLRLSDAVQAGFESGRCVQLDATAAPGPKGLEPGSTSEITASPHSKIDKAPTGGKVTAVLSAGGAGVSPTTPVPADASFTYQAPDEPDKGGTVSLESRSKRGVGKAAIDFDTKRPGYLATYNGGGISITGTILDLGKTFETVGVFAGGSVHFHHVPADAESGSINFNDPCGPNCVLSGGGSYSIADNGDGTLTMNEFVSACTKVTAGFTQETCNDNEHPVLLTPIS